MLWQAGWLTESQEKGSGVRFINMTTRHPGLQAFSKPAYDFAPQVILENGPFDSVLQIWVIVDFDNNNVLISLFQINPV